MQQGSGAQVAVPTAGGNRGYALGLLLLTLANFWAAFHAIMGAHSLRRDLEKARS